MQRFPSIDPQSATGKTRVQLDAVKSKMGMVPNLMKVLANSPAVLESYLGLSGALAGGTLSPKIRESIALAVAQKNRCDYCLAAHTMLGKKAGLSEEEALESRRGNLRDPRANAAVQFARAIIEKQAFVSDTDVAAVRDAGFNDGEIIEIIASVIQNIYTNYFNHIVETVIDFPKAPALTAK